MRKEAAEADTASVVEAEAGMASAVVAVAYLMASVVVAALAWPTGSVAEAEASRAGSVAEVFHTVWAAEGSGWAVRLNSEELRGEAASISAGALAAGLASVAHLVAPAHLISMADRQNHGSQHGLIFEVSIRFHRAETGWPATDHG
jgi:hypothetical protein